MLELIQKSEWKLAYALAYHFAFIDLALGFVLCILSGARFRAAARYYVLAILCGWSSNWCEKTHAAEVCQLPEQRATYRNSIANDVHRRKRHVADGATKERKLSAPKVEQRSPSHMAFDAHPIRKRSSTFSESNV